MNVCIISIQTDICGVTGGVSTHVDQLSGILRSMGHKVAVICPAHPEYPDEDHEEVVEGMLYFCIGKVSLKNLDAQWIQESRNAFCRLNKRFRFQCVFSEGIASQGIIKETAAHKVSCFCFLHNFGITHFYNIWKEVNNFNSLVYYLFMTIPRTFYRIIRSEIPTYGSCSIVLSCSSHNANRIRKFYRIKKEKIMVIHNWVDTAKFAPTSEMRELGRRRWRCPDEKLIFLMVGSLYLPKGLHIAIQSFSKFVKTYRDACLLVAGSGRHEKTLKDLAQKRGLKIGGNIHFLGEVRHCDLPLIYNAADIFLMPSLFIEGLPYTQLEAMSCGLPFIAAEIGGVTEAAGDVGILVPPGDEKAMMDAMTHLAKNMEERINVGRSARRRVMELFSEEVARSKLISVLEKANQ